ncbi:MAG: inorganic phosphate transporter [Legionellaceae bacterium]
MSDYSLFILLVVILAYCFDFINGFHDASNSIATIVTTGVLTPKQAVVWAAFFNLMGFFLFNLMVAKTIGQGIVDPQVISPKLIFAALTAAISWGLITWYYGLPSSSSHAIIGGLAGAAVASSGFSSLEPSGLMKVACGIFVSPILGLVAGLGLIYLFNSKIKGSERLYKYAQLISSSLLNISHGGNDAQKTMGIISTLLFSAAWIKGPFYIPLWVVVSCYAVISLGTLMGGFRIVRTLGSGITPLNPMRGAAAEMGAAGILLVATELGIPVSTTQTITGAIAGVGLHHTADAIYWPMLRRIFFAWLLTLPATGFIAASIILLS